MVTENSGGASEGLTVFSISKWRIKRCTGYESKEVLVYVKYVGCMI